ncbi:MAG TPA: globin [Acidimicrobiales bacterium]|nr:globin [Acidimicrobiales bacterium]
MAETLYDEVDDDFFARLVTAFYHRVEIDDVLRPLYPDDLHDSKRHLTMFLEQYWGGPHAYSDERGHPRLRLRHEPFEISAEVRDAWLSAMTHAVDSLSDELTDDQREALLDYFDSASRSLRNV